MPAPDDWLQPPSHTDLIRAARDIRAIARADDTAALTAALAELRADLADHVELEADEIDRLPGATPDLAHDGQGRLLDLVDRMLAEAEGHDEIDCVLAASELERRLRRQHRLETTLRLSGIA